MDVFLISATHFSHPTLIHEVCADPQRAADAALVLVNQLRHDLDPVTLPRHVGSWIDALAEAQRHRLAMLDVAADSLADEDLVTAAGFDVWIENLGVDVPVDATAIPVPRLFRDEIDTILAGLRLLQQQGCPYELPDVATNSGTHLALGTDAIDMLCERLNFGIDPAPPRIVVAIEGGLVSGIVTDQPVTTLVVDYDVEGADEDRIIEIPQDDGLTASAVATLWPDNSVTQDPSWLQAAYGAYAAAEEE